MSLFEFIGCHAAPPQVPCVLGVPIEFDAAVHRTHCIASVYMLPTRTSGSPPASDYLPSPGDSAGERSVERLTYLRRPGALLHQGRGRTGRLRPGRRQPLRSTALEAVPAAAVAGEVLGRAVRPGRPQAQAALLSGADGDPVRGLPRPARLPPLWLLHVLRLRGAGQAQHPGRPHSPRRRDRPLRDPRRLLRPQD